MTEPLRMATRGSALALAQSKTIADQVAEITGRPVEVVIVSSAGDRSSAPIETLGTDGAFVAAVRDALLDGRADFAVHSLKDLPTAPFDGLTLAATPVRSEPGDAVCARSDMTLDLLPAGSRVGTGSRRRIGLLKAMRPDLEIVPIRGNVDTRLNRVADGDLDAVVLAAAGLTRLDRMGRVTELLDPNTFVPAPGQGSLAIECRTDDVELRDAIGQIDHAATRAAVVAERTVLSVLQAGCNAPVGAFATITEPGFWEPEIHLRAVVVDVNGTTVLSESATGAVSAAAEVGHAVAEKLLAAGAAALIGEHVA